MQTPDFTRGIVCFGIFDQRTDCLCKKRSKFFSKGTAARDNRSNFAGIWKVSGLCDICDNELVGLYQNVHFTVHSYYYPHRYIIFLLFEINTSRKDLVPIYFQDFLLYQFDLLMSSIVESLVFFSVS